MNNEFTSRDIKGEDTVTIKIPPVNEWTLTQLRNLCKRNKVKGYTKMNKEQLIKEANNIIANL